MHLDARVEARAQVRITLELDNIDPMIRGIAISELDGQSFRAAID